MCWLLWGGDQSSISSAEEPTASNTKEDKASQECNKSIIMIFSIWKVIVYWDSIFLSYTINAGFYIWRWLCMFTGKCHNNGGGTKNVHEPWHYPPPLQLTTLTDLACCEFIKIKIKFEGQFLSELRRINADNKLYNNLLYKS